MNFPEVTLPEHDGSHRLLHIHRNMPGVLSRINEIFGQRGINIDGQFLRTDAHVGYVVIDISTGDAQAADLRSEAWPRSPAPCARASSIEQAGASSRKH